MGDDGVRILVNKPISLGGNARIIGAAPLAEPEYGRGVKEWMCRAIDRRTGEDLNVVWVHARSANEARKRARLLLPNYAKIVCIEYRG